MRSDVRGKRKLFLRIEERWSERTIISKNSNISDWVLTNEQCLIVSSFIENILLLVHIHIHIHKFKRLTNRLSGKIQLFFEPKNQTDKVDISCQFQKEYEWYFRISLNCLLLFSNFCLSSRFFNESTCLYYKFLSFIQNAQNILCLFGKNFILMI
jgi:hypothetical protein